MQFLRSIAAVLVGYTIFAVSGYAIFRLSGQAPHAEATTWFKLLTVVSGVLFALLGGYVAGWLAGRRPLAHAIAVALLLSLGAAVSLAATVNHGSIWTQVCALAVMAPAAVLGGWLREHRLRPIGDSTMSS